jgi:translation initiation factor IF-2
VISQASGAAAVQKMSAIARQRSDSSPQKTKAIRQPSFADAAEMESKQEQDRKMREEEAARRREERKRLDELQRRKDEQDAEDAARRIVESASRFARLKLEEEQRQRKNVPQQEIDDATQVRPPPMSFAAAQPVERDESTAAPARAGANSPVKRYLRNELRCERCSTCCCFIAIAFDFN